MYPISHDFVTQYKQALNKTVKYLLKGLELLDGLDGAEDLLLADPVFIGDVGKHGWLHKVSLIGGGATTGDHLGTLLLPNVDVLQDLFRKTIKLRHV